MTDEKKSIITSATTIDTATTEPPGIVPPPPPPEPPRKHSGEWVMPPTPPYAVLEDGRLEPLTNCPVCEELGLARFAHYHVCRSKVAADHGDAAFAELPKSTREILAIIKSKQRYYFRQHPEGVAAIRRTEDYQRHVRELHIRAGQLREGHWGHGRPHIYVETLSDAYVWARLVE
jgi:hypothetical protein